MIQCNREVMARKPDVAVVDKNERRCDIIDIVVSEDMS